MRLIYTNHAEENVAERNINKKIIEETLASPERIIDGRFGRKIAQKVVGNKLLRVIYESKSNTYIIITAYYTEPDRYSER